MNTAIWFMKSIPIQRKKVQTRKGNMPLMTRAGRYTRKTRDQTENGQRPPILLTQMGKRSRNARNCPPGAGAIRPIGTNAMTMVSGGTHANPPQVAPRTNDPRIQQKRKTGTQVFLSTFFICLRLPIFSDRLSSSPMTSRMSRSFSAQRTVR